MGHSISERALMARLEYTAVQRAASNLQVIAGPDGSGAWFDYAISGIKLGLREGVLIGAGRRTPASWAKEMINEGGGDIFKLTRLSQKICTADNILETRRCRDWVIVQRPRKVNEIMVLQTSYDETLAKLGRHTRRNIHISRRLAAKTRMSFSAGTGTHTLVSREVLDHLARFTKPAGVSTTLMQRLDAYSKRGGRSFQTVLRAEDGDVISYCCGFVDECSNAYLLYQLNNPTWHSMGPSLSHRGFLIEWLIGQGCGSLVFVHGCNGILKHACTLTAIDEYLVMRRSILNFLRTGAIATIWPNSSLGRLSRLALEG
jgi:hypothetical protein